MSDPLPVLRQYNVDKKEIIERDDQIIFGKLSWPKTTLTTWRCKGTDDFYSLECLLYFLKNIDLIHPEYVNQTRVDNIQAVRRPDRKDISDYLTGKTDKSGPSEKTLGKRKHDQESGESAAKKPHVDETQKQKARKAKKARRKAKKMNK